MGAVSVNSDEIEKLARKRERDYLLYGARAAHEFCAERIRQKLDYGANTETLLAEAMEEVRRDIGSFPSEETNDFEIIPEDETLERDMREIAVRKFEALQEMESYMWGLGIAGLFHQWERDTRVAIAALQENPPPSEKIEKMDFDALCVEVKKTGFDIERHSAFPELDTARLIANTVKHGHGKAFRQLVDQKPEFFQGGPVGVRMGNLPPQPHHIRVWHKHFDDAAAAIYQIWDAYEDATLGMPRADIDRTVA